MPLCTHCHSPLQQADRFCNRCGNPVSNASPSSARTVGLIDDDILSSLQSMCRPGEQMLATYEIASLGQLNAQGFLMLTNQRLHLVCPRPNTMGRWSVSLRDIVQVRFRPYDPLNWREFLRLKKPSATTEMTLVSRHRICAPVPIARREKGWDRKNREAIEREEVGLVQMSRPSRVGWGNSVLGFFSMQLPEGVFFDESGHCMSLYFLRELAGDVARFVPRAFSIRDTGTEPADYAPIHPEPHALRSWVCDGDALQWQWVSKPLAGAAGVFSRIAGLTAPSVYVTNKRIIVELAQGNKANESSEFDIQAVRCIRWSADSLDIITDAVRPQVSASIVAEAMAQAELDASQRNEGHHGRRRVLQDKKTVAAHYDWRAREYTAYLGDNAASREAQESLGAIVSLVREGLTPAGLGSRKSNLGVTLAVGEEVRATATLSPTQRVASNFELTNRRLFVRAVHQVPRFSEVLKLSKPWLVGLVAISLLFGVVQKSFVALLVPWIFFAIVVLYRALALAMKHASRVGPQYAQCEVFIDPKTRVQSMRAKGQNTALVVSWGAAPIDPTLLEVSFQKLSLLSGGAVGALAISNITKFDSCIVLPANPQEAEVVAAQLSSALSAVRNPVTVAS